MLAFLDYPTDKEKMAALFVANSERFCRVAFKYVKNYADAEDAVSSAMVTMMDLFDRVRDRSDAQTQSYCYAIIRTHCMRILEKRKKEKQDPYTVDIWDSSDTQESICWRLEHDIELKALGEALSEMSQRDKLVIEMKHYLQASDEEIATVLGCGVNSVRMIWHRAKERLRKEYLKKEESTHGE